MNSATPPVRVLGVIPARHASSRFPGKPLADIAGKPMIRRVWEQAQLADSLAHVVVATDDSRISDCVESFGGLVVMTSPEHPTGTDRMGEVARLLPQFTHYVNIQGDEPFIAPEAIDTLCRTLTAEPQPDIATLVKPFTDAELLFSDNTVKVVISQSGRALYFSRSVIPHLRGVPPAHWLAHADYYQHIGLYGFSATALNAVVQLAQGVLEKTECLEQLRWLQADFSIRASVVYTESLAVDVPEDVQRVLRAKNLLG